MEYEEELGLTQKEFNQQEFEKNLEATMADVVEYPDRYEFVVNMPGIRPDKIKVVVNTLENKNALMMGGEGDKVDNDEVKYLKRERHVGNFIKGCIIPWNADLEAISAVSKDGLLTVTIQKLLPTLMYSDEYMEATLADVVEYAVNMPGIRHDRIEVPVVTIENNNNNLRVLSMDGKDKVDNDGVVKYLKRERNTYLQVREKPKTFTIPWYTDPDAHTKPN